MPGRAESDWSVCSGTVPKPFQSEYCYTSISQMLGSTYSAYFCLSVQQAHYLLLCGWYMGADSCAMPTEPLNSVLIWQ